MTSLNGALEANRSIVVLVVPWSSCARRAAATIESLTLQLSLLNIRSVVVDEEAADVRLWLNNFARDSLGGDAPRGAGSLFWLQDGKVVDLEVAGGKMTLHDVLQRSRKCWSVSHRKGTV